MRMLVSISVFVMMTSSTRMKCEDRDEVADETHDCCNEHDLPIDRLWVEESVDSFNE
jgi:hypothetical protein